MKSRPKTIFCVLLVMLFCWIGFASAGEKVIVGKSWPAGQQVSMDRIDHSAWDQLLQKYVDAKGRVNYRAWQASENDVRALDNYLNSLSRASRNLEAAKSAKLAFWINAYNAVTVKGILREYPTSSIRNHTARFVGFNIWKDLLLIVGDSKISLESIEHDVLRKMGEPRIHFAIVCASTGCPRLLSEAYTADQLEGQLIANSKNFFANPANFQHDVQHQQFRLSSILNWFGEDFGKDKAARLKAVAPYLPTIEAYNNALGNRVSLSYLDYDWSLNEQK